MCGELPKGTIDISLGSHSKHAHVGSWSAELYLSADGFLKLHSGSVARRPSMAVPPNMLHKTIQD